MKKIFLVLLAVAALAALAAAQADVSSPKNIGKSKVFLQLNWSIDFGQSLPQTFTLKTFGFPTTPTQKARMEAGTYAYREGLDRLNNLLLEFEFSPTQRQELVSLRAFVDVDYSQPQPASPAQEFAGQSTLTQANAEIIAKAKELRGKAKDEAEALVLLTDWVHNRVKYDGPGYGSNVQNAQWVFENQLGTCDEYSHLLASMLRAVDIPAKFVAGFVCSVNCSESRNWGPHAWVEAFAGGEWLSSDPTFDEAILLDGTHVKFAEGRDQNDVKETLSSIANNFAISDVKLERAAHVSLDDTRAFEGFSLEVQAPNSTLGEAGIAVVTARAKSSLAKPVGLPLSISAPVEASVVGASDVLVFVPAGGEASREWKIVLPARLEEGFVYKFPVTVSTLGAKAEAQIEARKGGERTEQEEVRVLDLTPKFNEDGTLAIEVQLANTGNKEIVGAQVLLETNAGKESQRASIPVGGRKKIVFNLEISGGLQSVEGSIIVRSNAYELTQPIAVSLPEKRGQQPAPQPGQPAGNPLLDFINSLLAAILSLFGLQ